MCGHPPSWDTSFAWYGDLPVRPERPTGTKERETSTAPTARGAEESPQSGGKSDEVWEVLLAGIENRYGSSPNGIATGLADLPDSNRMPILRLVATKHGNHVTGLVIAAMGAQRAGVTPEARENETEARARETAAHRGMPLNPAMDAAIATATHVKSASESWNDGLRGAGTGEITQSPHPVMQKGLKPAAQGAVLTGKAIGHAVANPRETWNRFVEGVARSYDDGGGGLIGVLYAIGEHNPVTAAEEQLSELLDAISDGDSERAARILGGMGLGAAIGWGFGKLLGRFGKRRGGAPALAATGAEAEAAATAVGEPKLASSKPAGATAGAEAVAAEPAAPVTTSGASKAGPRQVAGSVPGAKGGPKAQLDTNLASALLNPADAGHAAAVAYMDANKGTGFFVNRHSYKELLVRFSKDQVKKLREMYGIRMLRDVDLDDIAEAAARIEDAFAPTDRVISPADARVAATSYLQGRKLATADLQFYKRARDLGLDVEFVGKGNAATKAAAYVPDPVTIAP